MWLHNNGEQSFMSATIATTCTRRRAKTMVSYDQMNSKTMVSYVQLATDRDYQEV